MTRRHQRIGTILLLTLLALGLVAIAPTQWLGWQALNAVLRRKFPAVTRIRTSELAAWLDDPGRTPPRLLDVREPAEYQVSHLAGAQQIEPGSDPTTVDLPKDQPIVTYCSVGYRSAAYAQKLRRAGFTNVRNLEGSIFEWANENRPLAKADGQPAEQVHPYNRIGGLLLRSDRRASVPSIDAKREN
ncbi:MAG: rhodanese-like domain-containing protein [Rhodospirillales bacterium]|nr:rhodanese-like domain-containing protein [Acetobacter sp.]